MSFTTEDLFLQSVIENPDDDLPRLIYSDWLEEHGEPRGEFIRVQCERARLSEHDPARNILLQREAALLKAHVRKWNGPVHRSLESGPLRGLVRSRRGWIKKWKYHRGFISDVTVHASAVIQHSELLARLGPVETLHVWAAHGQIPALLAAPIIAQLRGLDLSRDNLSAEEARLLTSSDRLVHLRWLDLRRNNFGPAVRGLAQASQAGRLPAQTWLEDHHAASWPRSAATFVQRLWRRLTHD